MQNKSIYVGLDVSKEHISVGVAPEGRSQPEYHENIPHTTAAIRKLAERLGKEGQDIRFCYEAGPFGYGLYRDLTALGHDCVVVAPALIPKKPGDRVKTDRRDSLLLARMHRSGELTPVWVPHPDDEAIRDLTRAREDAKRLEHKARMNLTAFLLRHQRRYPGKSRWTKAYMDWLQSLVFESPIQRKRMAAAAGSELDIPRQQFIDAIGRVIGDAYDEGAG